MNSHRLLPHFCLVFCLLVAGPKAVLAQGQDSAPGDRYLLIAAEMLPGVYDNMNQYMFDGRRGLPENDRHKRIRTEISRINAPSFGDHAFLWVNNFKQDGDDETTFRIATLEAGTAPDEFVMRHYFFEDKSFSDEELTALKPEDLRRTDGCDYIFKRRASQFRGRQLDQACRFEWEGEQVYTSNEIELSETGLWFVDHKYVASTSERITGVASGEPFWLERARKFHCYSDVPGVGGGLDIPFERFDDLILYDKGDLKWFDTKMNEERTIGIMLQAVTWHVNNEKDGDFNRDSLVLAVMEKMPDGTVKEHGYAFGEKSATRIGVNLKWMLANCAMVPRSEARPEM